MKLSSLFKKLADGKNLSREEAFAMQDKIITGDLSQEELIKVFCFFESKPITLQELTGIREATGKHMMRLSIKKEALDVCGTGGDGFHTFNISTITAIICAAAGIPIVKHCGRAASGLCGSADLLELLNININLTPKQAVECFQRCGIVFLFAPNFHPGLKIVKEARKKFGKKTYFNILGPVLNPANPSHQMIGVSDEKMMRLMGKTLIDSGSKRIILVHSDDGDDEVSLSGKTTVSEFDHKGEEKEYDLTPTDFGLPSSSLSDLKTTSSEENVSICLQILEEKADESKKNAVLINSALAFYTFGKTKNIRAGVKLARETISSQKALKKLAELIKVTNSL